MKKTLVFGLCLILALSTLTGCNSGTDNKSVANSDVNQNSIVSTTEASTEASAAEESSMEASVAEEPSMEESVAEESSMEAESSESEQPIVVAPTDPVEGLGSKYVDFENRTFALNGKAYTLGVTTLQDLIDDGVPFDEDDLADVNNNVKPNYQSSSFTIPLGKWYSAYVYVANYTEENATAASCILSKVYLPVDLQKEQHIIQFAFPLTITEEELLAQAGEPTDTYEYTSEDGTTTRHCYEYSLDSEKYYGSSGYTFDFYNNALRYITIDYLP